MERRRFAQNTYPTDTRYFLNGAAVWTILPQQLSWTVEDLATESRISLTAPDTPANRVNANSLSTGPELILRVNPANMPVIGARYGRYDIDGPGANRRYTGYARWLYQLSEGEKISLNYEAMRVDFTPPVPSPNFLRQDQFLRYERVSPVGTLTLDGGTTHIQPYGGEDTTGGLARVAATYALTSESAVRVLLADQISDSATDLIRSVTAATSTTMPTTPQETAAAVPFAGSTVALGAVYHTQRGELTYLALSRGIGYTLQGYARRVDYINSNPNSDYRETGLKLTLTWTQADEMRIYSYMDYLKRTFPGPDERDTERNSALGATYRLTSDVFVTVEGGLIQRDSNIFPPVGFLDRRVMLLLGYSTGPLFAPIRR